MMRAATRAAVRALVATATLVIVLLPADATAQVGQPQVGTGARLETYSFATPAAVDFDRVELLTVPVLGRVWLTRNVELRVSSAFARATVQRRDNSEATLSGPTDTEVGLTVAFARDRLRLGVVGVLPTGKAELTAEEMDVAGLIAADVLPFAISSWGSGGGVGVNAAVAVPLDPATSVGLSAGYVVAREYEPLGVESFAYRPGNQLHVRAALDRTFGGAGKGSLQLVYQQFATDESAGANLYQAGDRLQAAGSFAFAAGARGSGLVYAGYLRRQRGRYTDVVRVTPAQDLVYGGAAMRHPLGRVVLVPLADVRVIGNEDGINKGHTIAAGAGVEVPVGAFEVVPLARARFGSLTVRTDQQSSFTGMELGLTLRTRMFSR
jgi:hypothetical protein